MKLFVYGTLRPGGRFWNQIAPWVQAVEPTGVLGGFDLIAGDAYPLATPAAGDPGGGDGLVGEALVVDDGAADDVLAITDRIEGAPDLFERVCVGDVWLYVATAGTLGSHTGHVVPSGDWFDVDPDARAAWETEMACAYTGPVGRYGPL